MGSKSCQNLAGSRKAWLRESDWPGALIHSNINLAPLETLHSMPKPGDMVLLPGDGMNDAEGLAADPYRIERIEQM